MELCAKLIVQASKAITIQRRMSLLVEARLPDKDERAKYTKSGRGNTLRISNEESLELESKLTTVVVMNVHLPSGIDL